MAESTSRKGRKSKPLLALGESNQLLQASDSEPTLANGWETDPARV
jgi:hypothetical protein